MVAKKGTASGGKTATLPIKATVDAVNASELPNIFPSFYAC